MGIMDNSYDEWLSEMYCNDQLDVPMYKLLNPDIKMVYRNGLKIITTYEILEYTKALNKDTKHDDRSNKMNAEDVLRILKEHCNELLERDVAGNDNEYVAFLVEQNLLSVLNLIEGLEDIVKDEK